MTTVELSDAAARVADHLRGTCKCMHNALTELDLPDGIDYDATFCSELDQQVFCCTTCDWWCELSEMAEDQDGVCTDCADEEEDD